MGSRECGHSSGQELGKRATNAEAKCPRRDATRGWDSWSAEPRVLDGIHSARRFQLSSGLVANVTRRGCQPAPCQCGGRAGPKVGHNARRRGSSSVAAHVMNRSWVSPPTCTNATCVNPAASNSRMPATWRWTSGPHGICASTSSSRTVRAASSNDAGTGSSALTLHPPVNQRNWSIARFTAIC